jgi:hypothetical protein
MKITVGGVACGLAAVLGFCGVTIAQDAVQWRVEDGGNGHWYQRWPRSTESWDELRSLALTVGGDLASISSLAENLFVRDVAFPASGPSGDAVLGALNPGGVCGGQWQWVDGTEWSFTAWDSGQPDCTGEEVVVIYMSAVWHDYPRSGFFASWNGAIIEWSADCNGDGIVDYGQILDGTLIDINGNGVPDICECLADLNTDSIVNGADISVLLGYWGQSGKGVVGDINGDGLVDGADLAMLLSSWGKCP